MIKSRVALFLISLLFALIAAAFLFLAVTLCLWFGRAPSFSMDMFSQIDGIAFGRTLRSTVYKTCTMLNKGSFVIAGFMVIIAFEGLLAAKKAYDGFILFFAFASIIAIGMFLALAIYPLFVNPAIAEQFTESLWEIGPIGRAKIQDWLHCCGYANATDLVANSAVCPVTITPAFMNTTTIPGCLPTFETLLGPQNRNWGILMFTFALISTLGTIFAIVFRQDCKNSHYSSKEGRGFYDDEDYRPRRMEQVATTYPMDPIKQYQQGSPQTTSQNDIHNVGRYATLRRHAPFIQINASH